MAADTITPVTVDVDARLAWVSPGARWSDVDRATRRHGLAVSGGVLSLVPHGEAVRAYRLSPVEPAVLKLNVMYAIEDAQVVLRGWRELVDRAPSGLAVDCGIWTIPEAPELPRELRGLRTALVAGTWHGAVQDGYDAVRRYRTLAQPLLDLTGPGDDRLARVRAVCDPAAMLRGRPV